MPSTLTSILQVLTNLLLKTTLRVINITHHSPDRETEAWRGETIETCPRPQSCGGGADIQSHLDWASRTHELHCPLLLLTPRQVPLLASLFRQCIANTVPRYHEKRVRWK